LHSLGRKTESQDEVGMSEKQNLNDGLEDNTEFIGKSMYVLTRYGQIFLDKELKPYYLKAGQLHLLFLLFKNDGMNQESLARSINVDKAAVTRAIQKLIDEGYVTRERNDHDKRSYRVFLTERGKAIEPDIFAIAQKLEDIFLDSLEQDERDCIARSLHIMKKNIVAHMKN
jgi:DNA-binding MarR family transcriptional regulator